VIDDTPSAVQEQAIVFDEIARNMDAMQRIAASTVNSSQSAVTESERLQALAERSSKGCVDLRDRSRAGRPRRNRAEGAPRAPHEA
jgi:methyl-accepting chemotaxis protein